MRSLIVALTLGIHAAAFAQGSFCATVVGGGYGGVYAISDWTQDSEQNMVYLITCGVAYDGNYDHSAVIGETLLGSTSGFSYVGNYDSQYGPLFFYCSIYTGSAGGYDGDGARCSTDPFIYSLSSMPKKALLRKFSFATLPSYMTIGPDNSPEPSSLRGFMQVNSPFYGGTIRQDFNSGKRWVQVDAPF